MNRLTKRIHSLDGENIVVYTAGKFTCTTAAEMTSSDVRTVLRVLANYEDAEENNEQQVRHGRWEECSNELNKYCSNCGEIVGDIYSKPNYCENCGAKMEEE